jgi:hypothetical protein
MQRFRKVKEPARFDLRCRQRGREWLRDHPNYDRPHDYWTEFESELREGFHGLCGYCVMVVLKAEVDHFIPVAILKQRGQDELAYEWSNFRYGEKTLNARKWKHLVLDPFQVKDEWFDLLLPSLQLVLTGSVPKTQRKKAEFTLQQLGLRDDEVIVRYRRQWFEMYCNGQLTLEGLRRVAPLIARAVEKDRANGIIWQLQPPAAPPKGA